MYSYTLAPPPSNCLGGGDFLAYKKLVSSFFSPHTKHTKTQNNSINTQPISQTGFFALIQNYEQNARLGVIL